MYWHYPVPKNSLYDNLLQPFDSGHICAWYDFCSCRDAEDAVHARDGYDYDGYRLRVEFPRGGGPGGFRGSNRGGGGGGGDRGGRGRGPPARRSQYRVLVTGNVITAHEAWWVVT